MATVADMLSGAPAKAAGAPTPAPADNPFDQFDGQANPFDQFGAGSAPKRSVGDLLGMGARGIASGAGGLVDILAGPANATVNAATGSHLSTSPFRDAANAASDAAGLATPQSDQEKLGNAIVEGGTQGLATAGLGRVAAGVKGAAGTVATALAATPITDTVASAAATGASQVAAQHGAGPIGQLAAGLVGGVAGVGGARRVADILTGITERYGPKAAKLVTEVPREAVVDEKGNLTDEGKDVASHNGLHPDEVKAAYDDAQTAVQEAKSAPPAEPAAAAPAPVAEPAPVPETPTPTAAPEAAPTAAPEAPPEALPASAQDRVAQAGSEGIGLTRGQATQDFGTQEKEQTLLAQPTAEGNAARQFFTRQQDQIASAVDRFKTAFGNPEASAADRGQVVKDAITQLRDSGKAGVSALYNQAKQLAQAAGDESQNLIHLDTGPLLAKMRELFTDEAVPDQVRKALKQQAAKYGLIGEAPQTVEGETSVSLRDSTGQPASKITFTGPPQRLTLINAEDLRQKVNQLYDADTSKQTQSLKPLIDDAVQSAVERAAAEGTGNVGQAYKAARAAHVQQQQTFKAKDVVQKLIDWKRGTNTPVVLPENAIKTIFAGGKEAATELKKVKAVLLSKPTDKSKAAWQAIQAHAVADIFDKAMVINANPGGGSLGTISGAKLNTAIAKFGADKLKILLPEADFNQLMKLKRIIGDATIPISRTTNQSGSGYAVIRFLALQGMRLTSIARFVPGVGPIADTAAGLYKVGKEANTAKKTLEGVANFDPKAAAKADQPGPDPADYARRFIKTAGSDEMLAPLIASAANEQHR